MRGLTAYRDILGVEMWPERATYVGSWVMYYSCRRDISRSKYVQKVKPMKRFDKKDVLLEPRAPDLAHVLVMLVRAP